MTNSTFNENIDIENQQLPLTDTVDSINELIDTLNNLSTRIQINDDAPIRSGSSNINAGFSYNGGDPTYTTNLGGSSFYPTQPNDDVSIDRADGQTTIEFESSVNKYGLKEIINNLKGQHESTPLTQSDVKLLLQSQFYLYSPIRNGNSEGQLRVDSGSANATNYEYTINVTDNFINEANQFTYNNNNNLLEGKFEGYTTANATGSSIDLQEYYDADKRFFDYNRLNRDLDLKAVFSGNILESDFDILTAGAYLSLKTTDSPSGNSQYVSFESRDNDRNLDGIYNRHAVREDSFEYDAINDKTTLELGLSRYNAFRLASHSSDLNSDLEYKGDYSSAWTDKLESYSSTYSNDVDHFTLSFKGQEHIPDSKEFIGDIVFEANSPTILDFSDSSNHENLELLIADFESGNLIDYRTSLEFKVYGKDTSGEVGNFYYSIGKGGYEDPIMMEEGYEGEIEEFSGWLNSSNSLNGDYFAELDRVYINNDSGGVSFTVDGAESNIDNSWGGFEEYSNNTLTNYIPNWDELSTLRLLDFGGLDSAAYNSELYLKNQYHGESVLGFEYELSAIDALSFSEGMPFKSDALDQLAVLGDSVDWDQKFVLDITAESYASDYIIESTDITIDFDPNLFGWIDQDHIMIGGALPIANAVDIDNENGTIRIAAASLSDLNTSNKDTGYGISGAVPLVSIALDFDESQVQNLDKNLDGSLTISPLAFDISANEQETVFSRTFIESDSGLTNREIVTLDDLGGGVDVYGQDVTLYEAKINLEEQGDGLILGTQRTIGTDRAFTNLIRSQDTLTTSADWLNVGNIEANNLSYNSVTNENAELINASFSTDIVGSGSFENGYFVEDARESTTLTADIKITGQAGNVVKLSEGIVSVQAEGSEIFTNGSDGQGSSNLITFQGDLNYDGRVSMKDLAYLNAGAARQVLTDGLNEEGMPTEVATEASYSRDVDANFDGKIDLGDLSILDQDWGKTLHTSDQGFTGSENISWNELDAQSDSSWNNDSFKDQNSTEADASYEGSLESPTAVGVVGADGNETSNDGDLGGNSVFQDPLAI